MNPMQPAEKVRRASRTLTVIVWLWLVWTALMVALNWTFGISTLSLIAAGAFFVSGMGLATALWGRGLLRQQRQWLVMINEGEHRYVVTARNAMVASEIAARAHREYCPDGRYRTSAVDLDTALRKWDPEKLRTTLTGARAIPEWWTK